MQIETKRLKKGYDYLAPDLSEIRLLATSEKGGLCHCTVPPGKTSLAVKLKSVQEIWYFLEGQGEVARFHNDEWDIVKTEPGLCITIPKNTPYQFRNTSAKNPLKFIISTMPKWPGPEESMPAKEYWKQKR